MLSLPIALLAGGLVWSLATAAPKVDVHQVHPYRTPDNQLRYEYGYTVEDEDSGVVTGRWEERRGDVVKGEYSLLEPGGKVRSVSYEVDPVSGFHAVVKTSLPAAEYLSSQLYERSLAEHPEPRVALQEETRPPPPPYPDPPVNYHAINAAILGANKLGLGRRGRWSRS